MNSTLLGGLVAVAAVVILTLLLRAIRPSEPARPPSPAPDPAPEPWADDRNAAASLEESEDEDDDGRVAAHLVVAVTSDGHAFVPDRHSVRLLPPEEEGEEWKVGAGIKSATVRADKALAMSWRPGDLSGVRVTRGGADEPPWRLEALGRDGEYIPFGFETSEAADAARELFEHQRIVQLGEDEDGRRVPPSAEQFEEARRILLETEAELGMASDEEPR